MKNDKKILDKVMQLKEQCGYWINTVSYLNQDAYTDRQLEGIVKTAKEIEELHNTNTAE